MDNLKIKIHSGKERFVWFCGCEIEGMPAYSFEMEKQHEAYFDRENFNKIFICHINQKYKKSKYSEFI